MRCVLENDRIGPRARQLARLLSPLAPPSRPLACHPRFLQREVVLAVYLGEQPTSLDVDEWRFPTRVSKIRASYYERWFATDERRKLLFLDRAYLHLFVRTDALKEQKVLALHCDPNDSETGTHFKYKAGPHIHMSAAGDPLHHAHIALNNSDLRAVLASVAALTSALGLAVGMINEQVLNLY